MSSSTNDTARVFEGRAWVVRETDGNPLDNVDTDMIFHNAHLAVTDVAEMAQYAFGNLPGWEDFPTKARPGDVLVVGRNFGAGSSRQQAVDCFRALGVQIIVGESFGAIYKRNAINSGMPLLEVPEVGRVDWKHGDTVRVDWEAGTLTHVPSGQTLQGRPASPVQLDIFEAGDLFAFGRTLGG